MSKDSLLKLLLEDTPRDALREVIQEIMKRDQSIRDAVIRERVAEAAKQMEEQVERVEQKRRECAARSEGTSTNGWRVYRE